MGEFNGHQVCRMLATSEPAALLLCMVLLLPGETNAPRATKGTLVGFKGTSTEPGYSGSQGHQINNVTFGETSFGTGLTDESSTLQWRMIKNLLPHGG